MATEIKPDPRLWIGKFVTGAPGLHYSDHLHGFGLVINIGHEKISIGPLLYIEIVNNNATLKGKPISKGTIIELFPHEIVVLKTDPDARVAITCTVISKDCEFTPDNFWNVIGVTYDPEKQIANPGDLHPLRFLLRNVLTEELKWVPADGTYIKVVSGERP